MKVNDTRWDIRLTTMSSNYCVNSMMEVEKGLLDVIRVEMVVRTITTGPVKMYNVLLHT